MTTLQQPYFLECNCSNSTILSTDNNYNAVWSSDISPFQLKPGIAEMPLKPINRALPITYSSPEVERINA